MKRNGLKAKFALSALALAVTPAMAVDLRFDGFASFVAGQVLDKDELTAETYNGFNKDLSYEQNSLFALQVRADLQQGLSATAQIIAKGADDYDAKFNWAYVSYELNNEWTVRAGRFRTPLFLYSDFLDVGYAYHWIEPPQSVYNLGGFDSTDGVQLEYMTTFGNWTSSLFMTAGATEVYLEELDGTLDSRNAWTLGWTLNYDWFTFHIVHSEADNTLSSDAFTQLADALALIPGITPSAIDDMLYESDRGQFTGMGISADTGDFFAVAEITQTGTTNAFTSPDGVGGYISLGMRIKDWTPYATVESRHSSIDQDIYHAIVDPIDALLPLAPVQLGQLKDGVHQLFYSTEIEQLTYSAGVRYNFHPSASLKMEYMQTDDKEADKKPSSIAIALDLVY